MQTTKPTVRDIKSFCGWNTLLKLVKASPVPWKGLISALFETGGRVNEVLKLRGENFDLKAHPKLIIVRDMILSKRYEKIGEVNDPKKKSGKRWITKRVRDTRTFPIRKDEPLVPFLVDTIKIGEMFPWSRVSIFYFTKRLSKIMSFKIYPHWFRGQRACQLAEEYGFREMELRQFFGWKPRELDMAEWYARLSWRGLAKAMGVAV